MTFWYEFDILIENHPLRFMNDIFSTQYLWPVLNSGQVAEADVFCTVGLDCLFTRLDKNHTSDFRIGTYA